MNSGDKTFINLYEGYRILNTKNKKLDIQRIGLYTILRRVLPLAYELEILNNWRIYPVIFITHLKSAPHGKDSYNRKGKNYPLPLEKGDFNAE
jgi:hypothetical protein